MIEFVLNEFVRRTLLLQLDAAYPHSLPMKTLKLGHRRYKLSVKGIDFLNDERRNANRL